MVKKGVSDPGISHQRDWYTGVILFMKEEAESIEDWLGSTLGRPIFYKKCSSIVRGDGSIQWLIRDTFECSWRV